MYNEKQTRLAVRDGRRATEGVAGGAHDRGHDRELVRVLALEGEDQELGEQILENVTLARPEVLG